MSKKRLFPLVLLLALIAITYFTKIHKLFNLESIQNKRHLLQYYLCAHPFLFSFAFISIYTISTCLVIPDSTLLTLLAGMIFSKPLALFYSLFSETLGAFLFYSAIRFLGKAMVNHENPLLHRMRLSFQANSVSYLLFLRVSHFLPYWLINFCAAYFNTPWRTFIWTTCVGVLPLTYLLVQAGHELGIAIEQGKTFKLSSIFTPEAKLTFLALGLVFLVPIIYKSWKKRGKRE